MSTSKPNPYYINTHPYTRVSAGIRALHLLCHNLNLRGIPAYMVFIGDENNFTENSTQPDFLTPILTQRVARAHYEAGQTPVMVYPEIIPGNPYDSPCVVRYVLNFPGLLGGDKTYAPTELSFGYSKTLAEATAYPENILFIPASDTQYFYPPQVEIKREGACFYASKYQREHKGALFDVTQGAIEITSRMPDSQSPEEIGDLFRKSEVFYTYENTALALEATLCGCPAVFLPNPHLEKVIASEELGLDGIAWGADPAEIDRARKSVGRAWENYQKALAAFQSNLTKFIEKTQAHSEGKRYSYKQYLEICKHIVPSTHSTWHHAEISIKEQEYAPLLAKLPSFIEREIGGFLCKIGLTHDGEFLWNRGARRAKEALELKDHTQWK